MLNDPPDFSIEGVHLPETLVNFLAYKDVSLDGAVFRYRENFLDGVMHHDVIDVWVDESSPS